MLALYLMELPDDLERHLVPLFLFQEERRGRHCAYKRLVFQFPIKSPRKFIEPRRKGHGLHLGQVLHTRQLHELMLVSHYALYGLYS